MLSKFPEWSRIKKKQKKAIVSEGDYSTLNTYFSHHKEWYALKFLYPYAHFTYFLILAFLLLPFTKMIIELTNEHYEINRTPFPINFDDTTNSFSHIERIGKANQDITTATANYLISKYIILRESYSKDLLNEENWRKMLNGVKNLSARKIFNEFINFIDIQNNPDSPILKYKTNYERNIKIRNIKFQPKTGKPNFAQILFTASVIGNTSLKEKDFLATIEFEINNLNNANTDPNSIIFFKITEYNVQEVLR